MFSIFLLRLTLQAEFSIGSGIFTGNGGQSTDRERIPGGGGGYWKGGRKYGMVGEKYEGLGRFVEDAGRVAVMISAGV